MGVYLGKKEVGLVLNVTVAADNIDVMKTADYMSNTLKGTNYNLTEAEYEEAHKELQTLMKKQMYGEEVIVPDTPSEPETDNKVLGIGDIDLTNVLTENNKLPIDDAFAEIIATYILDCSKSELSPDKQYQIEILNENDEVVFISDSPVNYSTDFEIFGDTTTQNIPADAFYLRVAGLDSDTQIYIAYHAHIDIFSGTVSGVEKSTIMIIDGENPVQDTISTYKTLRITEATSNYSLRPTRPTSSWYYVFDKETNKIIKVYENGGE